MKIIHLSDLHFGTEKNDLVEQVIEDSARLNPDLVVVSGDLTQRAKHQQFKAAAQFLSRLNANKVLCVPGNHDISLYNPLERFFYPFTKYRNWIASQLCNQFTDANIAMLGINSVTPYKPMSGYVTQDQLDTVKNFFEHQPESATRVVVMHHNLIRSERHKIINDADKILQVFINAGVNIVLSGHIHFSYIEEIKNVVGSKPLYVITSGTPISVRTTAPNSYNILDINADEFRFTIRSFLNNQFVDASSNVYRLRKK